jgi:F420-non-reducing hydrogenase large subunit
VAKVGLETGKKVIGFRRKLRDLMTLVGGKAIHPVLGLPGGVAKRITKEDQEQFRQVAGESVTSADLRWTSSTRWC